MLNRDALVELRDKYATMLAMRRRHDAGEEDARVVRREMAQLAARHPGSLREIDDLSLGEIARRVAALEEVLSGERKVESWMSAAARFHSLTRGALCAKRWLGRRRAVDEDLERAYESAVASFPFPADARQWSGALQELAAPPRGRITDVVFARVASELNVSEAAARELVFGVPRRHRRR